MRNELFTITRNLPSVALSVSLRYTLIGMEVILFAGFVWATATWFRKEQGKKRWELWFIELSGIVIVPLQLAIAIFYPVPQPALAIIGIGLVFISALCFYSTINIYGSQAPSIAFTKNISSSLKTTGFYAWIRHPFYSSYLLAWLGGAIGTGCWWLLGYFFFMCFIYHRAAVLEEKQWLSGADGSNYAAYMSRTGRFLINPVKMIKP